MAKVQFASSIARHTTAVALEVPGTTLRELFNQVFDKHPSLQSYLLDDQSAVRKHVAIYINERTIVDRDGLSDAVADSDRVYVFQALSGG